MRIDQAGEKSLALQIDAFGARGRGLHNFRQAAHRDDPVAANRHRFGVGIVWVAGEYFRVK